MKNKNILFILIIIGATLLYYFATHGNSKKELNIENSESFFNSIDCSELKIFEGNPNYWDEATGANCILEDGSAIVIRVFSQNSTDKILGDWAELINDENQIIYSDNWFATGKRSNLLKTFDGYSYKNITSEITFSSQPSTEETEISICSSISYSLIEQIFLGEIKDEDLVQYFEYYPGIEKPVKDVSSALQMQKNDMEIKEDYEYEILQYASKYDDAIKNGCKQ